MLKKYNIALIPNENHAQYIQYAQSLSQHAPAANYHIGGSASIPHVSLCHFLKAPEQIAELWQTVKNLAVPDIHLIFTRHVSKTFRGNPKYHNIWWVSLIPNHLDKLTARHMAIADIVKNPLNAAYAQYDPHMTLFNSRSKAQCAQFNQNPQLKPPLEGIFHIALGLTDQVGQITELVYP